MKDLKKRLEDMQNSLGLNVADVQQRLRLLLLDDPAMAGLAEHVDALETLHSDVVDALHRHMLQFPETSAQLQQPGMLQRLKGQQQRYYQQLLHGPYDLQYARLRLLVGLSHEREQVEQKWYLGAYHFYLNHMQGAIRAHWAHDPELADRLFACLLKIVFFDLTLAVDTYSAANKLALEESRARYAGRWRARTTESGNGTWWMMRSRYPSAGFALSVWLASGRLLLFPNGRR